MRNLAGANTFGIGSHGNVAINGHLRACHTNSKYIQTYQIMYSFKLIRFGVGARGGVVVD